LGKTNNSPGEYRDYHLCQAKVEHVYEKKSWQETEEHSTGCRQGPPQPQAELIPLNLGLINIDRHVTPGLGSTHHSYKEEQHHGTTNGNQDTIQVEPGDTRRAKGIHQEAADQSADDTDDDIRQRTHLGIATHDHAGDPAGQRPQKNPKQYVCKHFNLLLFLLL
jgi:hypothetical protein